MDIYRLDYIRTFLLLILLVAISLSQPDNIKFEHLSVKDGLSNNFCYCTFQDKDGYIWVGTEDGLNRWDGYSFTIFRHNPDDSSSISNDKILWITEDSEGILWISTSLGLNRYDKTTEEFKRYFFNDPKIKVPHTNSIGPIVEDNADVFWIGTKVGLVRFNSVSGAYKRFIPEPGNLDFSLMGINAISWIFKLNDSELLIGSADGLLKFKIPSKEFIRISPAQKMRENERLRPVTDAIKPYQDKQGQIWIQTIEGGLHKYSIEKQKLSLFRRFHHISGITVFDQMWSICEDRTGKNWVATIGEGLYCVDIKKEKSYHYVPDFNNNNSISSRWLTNIVIDKQGALWVATFDKGINKITFSDKAVLYYKKNLEMKKSPPAGEIMDLCEDNDGWVWIATLPGGAAKLNLKTKEFIHIPYMTGSSKATVDRRICTLLKDRVGVIWLGSLGLDKYNAGDNTFTHYVHNPADTNSINNNFIISLFEDKNGYIWCGMRGTGLDRFDPNTHIFKHYRHNPANANSLCNDIVRIVHQDYKGFLWLGTEDGLSRLEFTTDGKHQFTTYMHQRDNHYSLTDNFVYSVFEDSRKRLWVGTDRGLNLFNRTRQTFSSFPQIKQIHTTTIYSIVEDDHSNLWLRTNIGLIRFNPETKKYRVFDEKDGLEDCRSIVYGYQGFTKGKDGTFYYGAPQSLTVFHPDSLETKRKPPEVVLSNLRINYKPVEIGADSPLKKALNFTEELKLNYKQKNLSVQFSALDYLNPDKIQFTYKMEGVNEDWVNCGNQRTAPYTNLDHGQYIFRVKASYNNEDWSEQAKSVIITIAPPWWETWWAFSAYFIVAITVILGAFRFEIKRREAEHRATVAELQAKTAEAEKETEKEQMRSRIARDLHDEIGSNLSSIAMLGQALEKKVKLPGPEKERLRKIPQIARSTAESMRDIVWFVNPSNDSLDKLLSKMRETANTMLDGLDIVFNFEINKSSFKNDLNFRRNLFLLFKETLQNIARHAQATQVTIKIFYEDHQFKLIVEDNGIGFDSNAEFMGNGLTNFQRRAGEMNGKFVVHSEPGKGVEVKLTVNIP